jgi:hypothetical protein
MTCEVSGQRLIWRVISSRRVARAASSGIFAASRKRYSCWASSNCSTGSAVVSMSKTSVAMVMIVWTVVILSGVLTQTFSIQWFDQGTRRNADRDQRGVGLDG